MKTKIPILQAIFFFVLVLSNLQNIRGQIPNNPAECVVHLDKSFYVTGEYIWFKLYLPVYFNRHEITLRVSLFNKNSSVHEQFFIQTKGKTYADGYFKIPFDWQSDTYQIEFSGLDKTNKQAVLISRLQIPIFNDLEEMENKSVLFEHFKIPNSNVFTSLPSIKDAPEQIQVDLAPSSIGRLEKTTATIRVLDENGQALSASLSVAIRDSKMNPLANLSEKNMVFAPSNHHQNTSKQNSPLQLDNQIFLQYRWPQTTPELMGKRNLLAAYSPQNNTFHYALTNEKGAFLMYLPFFEGTKTFQFIGLQSNTIAVEKVNSLMNVFPSLQKSPANSNSQTVIDDYLKNSRLRKKIYQLYATTETLPSFEAKPPMTPNALNPDRNIRIEDYKAFATLPIFLKEIYTPLKYRKISKGKYGFKMFNPSVGRRVFYEGIPLFVVDGQLSRNSDFIADLDIGDIEALDLFFYEKELRKNFGIIGMSGVTYITTKSKQVKIPESERAAILSIEGLQPSLIYPIEVQVSSENPEIPQFRPLIYWQPHLETDANGEIHFSFRHSHDKGKFVIEVVAQTRDGKVVVKRKLYEVN